MCELFLLTPLGGRGEQGQHLCRVPRANLRWNLSIESSEKGCDVAWRGGDVGETSEVPTAH